MLSDSVLQVIQVSGTIARLLCIHLELQTMVREDFTNTEKIGKLRVIFPKVPLRLDVQRKAAAHLSVELQHEPEHAVGGGVLGPEVELHVAHELLHLGQAARVRHQLRVVLVGRDVEVVLLGLGGDGRVVVRVEDRLGDVHVLPPRGGAVHQRLALVQLRRVVSIIINITIVTTLSLTCMNSLSGYQWCLPPHTAPV